MERRGKTGIGLKIAAVLAAAAVLTAGCGESKDAREARLAGIGQMNQGNYEEAIASFDTALSKSGGLVGEFELDVLKYRAEAEYMTEDFAAAAHTYGILADVDGGKPEYSYYEAASEALAGNLDAAVAAYERAAGGTGEEKTPGRETQENKEAVQPEGEKQTGSVQEEAPSALQKKSVREAALSEEAKAGRSLALSAIGKAYEDQELFDEAMDFYESAAESGLTADLCNRMGLCMMAAGRYDEAISYFETGMTLGDEVRMPDLKYNEAAAYEYKGNFEKALELLNAYIAAYGSSPELKKELTFLESR